VYLQKNGTLPPPAFNRQMAVGLLQWSSILYDRTTPWQTHPRHCRPPLCSAQEIEATFDLGPVTLTR
jgi:hypothetical protein